jgi:hypothetical protein
MVRVLIDEDIDIAFRHHLDAVAHAETVQYRGWKGLKNGALLTAAAKEYDALVTMDDHLPDQQDLGSYDVAVLILKARTKKLEHLIELLPELTIALGSLQSGSAVRIYPPSE